jgi:O-antigen ligase
MATAQRKLRIAPTIKLGSGKARKKSTIRPRSPIYRALYEFLQHETAATVALYLLGIAKGAFFPACAFFTAHSITLQAHPIIITVKVILTAFCLMFSFPTALQFGKVAFDGYKGIGFAVGLELAILGMIQFLLGYTTIWNGDYFFDGRITSTLGQPNFLSAFLLTSLPFFIRKEKFHSIGLGIIVMCLALTFSRLNLLLIVIALIFSILRAANKKIKYLGICFLTICAIGTIIFFTTVRTDEIYNKIRKNPRLYQLQRNFFFLSKEQLYGEKRFAIYAAGIETILERPVIGYGKAMIEPAMRDNLRKYPVLDTLVVDSSHNIIIDIAIEGGVLALSLLIALLSLTLYRLSSANLWSYKYAFLLLVISSQFFITSIVAFVYLMMLTAKTTTQN